MGDIEDKAKTLDFRGTAAALIISAFGFVAALFWKDAIQAMIDSIVPARESLGLQFMAAVIVTFIAVVAIYLVTQYAEQKPPEPAKPAGKQKR